MQRPKLYRNEGTIKRAVRIRAVSTQQARAFPEKSAINLIVTAISNIEKATARKYVTALVTKNVKGWFNKVPYSGLQPGWPKGGGGSWPSGFLPSAKEGSYFRSLRRRGPPPSLSKTCRRAPLYQPSCLGYTWPPYSRSSPSSGISIT